MSHRPRKGDPPNLLARRRERFFLTNGSWYLTTREGIYVGPFPSKTMAEEAAKELISLLIDVNDPKVAEAFVREFRRRAIETPVPKRRA